MNALVNSVRLRQLDRILGQWTDVEIERMDAAQTCGIALLTSCATRCSKKSASSAKAGAMAQTR